MSRSRQVQKLQFEIPTFSCIGAESDNLNLQTCTSTNGHAGSFVSCIVLNVLSVGCSQGGHVADIGSQPAHRNFRNNTSHFPCASNTNIVYRPPTSSLYFGTGTENCCSPMCRTCWRIRSGLPTISSYQSRDYQQYLPTILLACARVSIFSSK
jgi:hypothetical protein